MNVVRPLPNGGWRAAYYRDDGSYGWSNRFATEEEARAWAEAFDDETREPVEIAAEFWSSDD
jgi:hypothetical protein